MLVVLPVELELLRNMQPLDRDLFYYLAERMDFATGVIGRSRRVSYGGMAYDLSEQDGERRKKESLRIVTSKQIENALGRLVNAGLLSRQSKSGFGQSLLLARIFWQIELDQDKSEQKPDGSQMGVLLGLLNKIFPHKNKHLEQKSENRRESELKPVGTTSFTQQQQQENEKFCMTLDWMPTDAELEMILFRAGKQKDDIKPEWIAEFVGYWFAEGKRQYSQREWTYRLAVRMVDYMRDPSLFDRLHGSAQTSTTGKTVKSKTGLPDWANPPADNEKLGAWMRQHGYGDGPQGLQCHQTRNWLRQCIEAKLKDYRRLS